MRHQPFIASYPKDFEWLRLCLRSFDKHRLPMFEPPVVCTASDHAAEAQKLCQESCPGSHVVVYDNEPGTLRAQVAMMHSDQLCPEADYLYFVGSDCVLQDKARAQYYFTEEGVLFQPDMFFNSYKYLLECGCDVKRWQTGTSRHLGFEVENEFMRRLPLAYSPAILEGTRQHLSKVNGMHWTSYMASVWEDGDFSESNVIGAWAWEFSPGAYNWVCRDPDAPTPHDKPNPLRQFWSHGGLDRPDEADGVTPRSVYEKVLG